LQRELDGFVETDDIVRKNLDRKERVHQLRSHVDDALKRSEAEVQARSPMKRSGGFNSSHGMSSGNHKPLRSAQLD
jgi:hypothetical protein